MNRLARFAGFGSGEEQIVDRDDPNPSVGNGDAVVEKMSAEELREPIIAALRQVHDPEIPVNIYDLGLIYTIDIADNGNVNIDMTLTVPRLPSSRHDAGHGQDAVQRSKELARSRSNLSGIHLGPRRRCQRKPY